MEEVPDNIIEKKMKCWISAISLLKKMQKTRERERERERAPHSPSEVSNSRIKHIGLGVILSFS